MTYFPPVEDEGAAVFLLQTVSKHLQENPDYLDDPDCPYGADLREMLRKLAPESLEIDVQTVIDADPDEDRWEFLDKEVQALFMNLKEQAALLGNNSSSEKMSYFRTATSLLEKLVTLQERTVGMKRIAEFQNTVLDVMDEVLNADQRTTVMTRLEQVIHGS